jgi:hypothetical protein
LLTDLAWQEAAELGEADGAPVFGPSSFLRKGTASVGEQWQRRRSPG